jgi:endonuclease YncB( thermonuclease family)
MKLSFCCCVPLFNKVKLPASTPTPVLKSTAPIQWADTIPFIAPITDGEVIKVYDGDTITIASKLPFPNSPMYRFQVRLNGIDCPEIKGGSEEEKAMAIEVRDKLSGMILHKNVILANVKTEKYGRLLADVFLDTLHLNKWLLDNRYAVEYDGGTKKSPESWLDYHVNGVL